MKNTNKGVEQLIYSNCERKFVLRIDPKNDAMIKYNKLYQSLKKVSAEWHAGHVQWFYTWNYLKFYSDGICISASMAGDDVNLINGGFNKGEQNITHGKFDIEGTILKLIFDGVEVNGAFNNDGSIIIEGKINWDIFYPIS